MSASVSTRLRQLATQHHRGELDLQTYRRLRADLLERLVAADAGAAPVSVEGDESSITLPKHSRAAAVVASAPASIPAPAAAVPPAPVPPTSVPPAPVPPASVPAQRTPVAAPTPIREATGGGVAGKLVVVAVLLAALGGGAFWYLQMRPAAAVSAEEAPQAAGTSEGYRVIADFLAQDDWSDDQIATFNSRWSTLADPVRMSAMDEQWYRDFVGRVRSQVKERRALTATSERAGAVEGPLLALANSLGIDVSSPDAIVIPGRVRAASSEFEQRTEPRVVAKPASSASLDIPPKAAAPAAAKATANAAHVAPAPQSTPTPVSAAEALNPDKCRVELVRSRKPRCRDALKLGGFGPFMALIPNGGFEMGSKQSATEQPVHHVTIAKPFAIAEHEASQTEFQLFCAQTKRQCEAQPWQGGEYPVVRVSWQDARDYAAWLSSVTGKTYRLATEAEWEYAARGGGGALFPSGDALSQTDAVFSVTDKLDAPWPRERKINANVFRLYHSIGNVREWVEDAWAPNFAGAPEDGSARGNGSGQRVARGGAYSDSAAKLRFTTREGIDATTRDLVTGFRVVREL